VSSFDQYIEHLEAGRRPVGGEEKLTPAMRKLENIFLGLRRQEGISLDMLEGRERDIRALVDGRLASLERGRLILTQDGFLVADEITQVLTR
jgi:coproporphyrinogen III oxidase-like Fe-S oxidoreductase